MFKALARLLVDHCVDSHAVRAAVSGSSALLSIFFDRTVASGFRLITYSLPDPEPEAVLRVLRARGYTADEAADIVALCGTRLRLLDEPLKLGAAGHRGTRVHGHSTCHRRRALCRPPGGRV